MLSLCELDTWNSKIASFQMAVLRASDPSEKEAKSKEWAAAIEKEIEPLLADAAPFFGGSEELTFAEVMTAPFVLRWFDAAQDGELMPASLAKALDGLPNFSKWKKAVEGKASVTKIYDGQAVITAMKARMKKMQEGQK